MFLFPAKPSLFLDRQFPGGLSLSSTPPTSITFHSLHLKTYFIKSCTCFTKSYTCFSEFPGGLPCPPSTPPTSISWPRAPTSPQPDSWHRLKFTSHLLTFTFYHITFTLNLLTFSFYLLTFQRRIRRSVPNSG